MDDQRTNREIGASVKAPQFSLQRMLAGISLVAVGAGVLAWSFRSPHTELKHQIGPFLDFICIPMIGGGLFTPFKRPILGALIFLGAWLAFLAIMEWLVRPHVFVG
jgi:hypothetical protein